jgi:hypothetical protein
VSTDAEVAGRICESLIEAAKADRKKFDDEGNEVGSYAYGKDTSEFDWKGFPGGKPMFEAKVAKMAQAVDIFGPYLYPANPTRKVTPRGEVDQFTAVRLKRLEDFLNYTPTETDLYTESMFTTNEAVVRGRGVMWTGLDRRRGLVHSVADSVDNLLKDPDVKTERDVNWKARKRFSPRWELAQRYPKMRDVIWGLSPDGNRKSDGKGSRDVSTELVSYQEMYCRVGLHHYKEGFELVDQERDQGMADDSPRKYVVSGNKIIWSGPWDMPWFRDNDWPCTELDLRDSVNSLWPKSPLWTGICHQRALNWIYGVYMTRMAQSFRKIIGVLEGPDGVPLSLEDLDKALYGDGDQGNIQVVTIKWKGQEGVQLKNIMQELVMTSGAQEFEQFWQVVGREFEEATGLYQVLHEGDVGRQMRSKAEVDLKQESSRTRINFYKERVEKFQSKLARKEAIAAMFLQPRDVLAKIWGPQAAMEFGTIMSAQDVEEQKQAALAGVPGADPYGIDFEKVFYEADYSIESGSMRTKTPEQAQDAMQGAMTNILPVLQQMGMTGPIVALLKGWAKVNQLPEDVMASLDGVEQQAQVQQQNQAGQQQQQQQAEQQQAMALQERQHAHEHSLQQVKMQADMQAQREKHAADARLAMQQAQHEAMQRAQEKEQDPAEGITTEAEPAESMEPAAPPAPPVIVNLTVNNPAKTDAQKRVYTFDRQGGTLVVGAESTPEGV